MAIKNGVFKVKNVSTGELDEVMPKTTLAQVDGLNKLTGATANAAGVWGLAPAPAQGSQSLPLCGDATYKVLPVEGGGTGANTVAAAVQALLGSSAVGSSTKSIYYDGETLKACADSIGGGGIVAALLEQNGYVKFANGLILQWGYVDDASNYSHIVELSFTIDFATTPYIIDTIMALKKESSSTFFCALPVSVTNTTAKLYYSGYGSGSNNTRGYFWLAIGN